MAVTQLEERSEEERSESWLIFNLHLVHVDNDILQVGRMEDYRAKVAFREAQRRGEEAPEWTQGRGTWRDMRTLAGLSRGELAEKIGCDRASISRYESGARWPDNNAYAYWLKEAYDAYLAEAVEDANLELLLRDKWMSEDPDRGERAVKWNVKLNDGQLEDILAMLDERVVQPWITAGHPDRLEGHYTPEDHRLAV